MTVSIGLKLLRNEYTHPSNQNQCKVYDFTRHRNLINISNEEAEIVTLFVPTFTKHEIDYYKNQMKELQKGYMKLMNLNS